MIGANTDVATKEKARTYIERARQRIDQKDLPAALSLYRRAALVAPQWSVPQRRLGELAKRLGRWDEALQHSSCALDLDPLDSRSLWNLGVAATALKRWDDARISWMAFGIEGLSEQGEPCYPAPMPIRIPMGDPEEPTLVWCDRIDPVRYVVTDVPGDGCGYRHGDVLLMDRPGEDDESARERDLTIIGLLDKSPFSTFEARVSGVSEEWVEAVEAGELDEGAIRCWSLALHIAGTNPDHNDDAGCEAVLGIAARDEDSAYAVLEQWCSATDEIAITAPLRLVLDASKA